MKEMPESERPREKLMRFGVKALSNAELLATLIRTGTKEASAVELSRRVLSANQGGLRALADCTVEELNQIKGIGTTKATQIIAAVELGKRLSMSRQGSKLNIKSPLDIANIFMEEMRYYKKEYFNTILLNTKNEIISTENISIGSLNSSLVHPREVFVSAIRKSASSMILIHNHPSGNPKPSNEDIKITKRLIEVGKIVGIEVLDHIVIGDGRYISLKEIAMI